jgi:hypothetical protein
MCAADAAAGLLRYARNDSNTPLLAAGLFILTQRAML